LLTVNVYINKTINFAFRESEPVEKKIKTNGATEQPASDYSAYWSQYQVLKVLYDYKLCYRATSTVS
jgi:hypothetical protein